MHNTVLKLTIEVCDNGLNNKANFESDSSVEKSICDVAAEEDELMRIVNECYDIQQASSRKFYIGILEILNKNSCAKALKAFRVYLDIINH